MKEQLLPVALLKTPSAVTASMIVYGIGWIIGTTNLQATVQLACAPWVRARGLALYQAVFNGGMGFGAVAWGWLGTYSGLPGESPAGGERWDEDGAEDEANWRAKWVSTEIGGLEGDTGLPLDCIMMGM